MRSVSAFLSVALVASAIAGCGGGDGLDRKAVTASRAEPAIAAGGVHTCALTSTGSVQCWGGNYSGQLGNDSTTHSPAPVEVIGLSGPVSAIAAGGSHTCALTSAGGVQCWGSNFYGQLGNDSRTDSLVPVDVVGLSGSVSAITAGSDHACALMSAGGVQCWGYDYYGQSLTYDAMIGRPAPVEVVGLSGPVSAIAAGVWHTCALTSAGSVQCWGVNWEGQLGDGSTTGSPTPVDVAGLSGPVSAIAAGGDYTCALTSAGGVQCWGANSGGQLGNDSTMDSSVPVNVIGLSGAVSGIAAGIDHTCALMSAGSVECWGNNYHGQLGNDSTTDSLIPVGVIGLSGPASAIAAGSAHACTLMSAGGVQCWGDNQFGQLGNDITAHSPTPADVIGLSGPVSAIAAGSAYTCALTSTGGVQCWGGGYYGRTTSSNRPGPMDVIGLSGPVSAIATGALHTCAVTSTGGVQCWGYNSDGQLGNTSTSFSFAPVDVIGLSGPASAIAAGEYHTCALMRAGGVQCWGNNVVSQLGNGCTASSSTPVDVIGLSGPASAIAAGEYHTCALMRAGGVQCWGAASYAASSCGGRAPMNVIGLSEPVSAIAAGDRHTCALLSAGGVQCWGNNSSSQLGNDSTTYSFTPLDVLGLSGPVSAIAAGLAHTCAVMSAGGVRCWGENSSSQLGSDSITSSPTPVDVIGLSGPVSAIAAGDSHTCALMNTAGVQCWGDNYFGQLGNGEVVGYSVIPVDVVGLNE